MWTGKIEDFILYEDNEIIVCHKPAGIAVQNARIGVMDLESALKNYLTGKAPGTVPYLGIIHRLDQPVEGALVFAKTPGAAKELSRQMAAGETGKHYLAVTGKKPPQEKGTLEDFLKKDGRSNMSHVVPSQTKGAKRAVLHYELLEKAEDSEKYLLAVQLETGRHHQIRVQMMHGGMPLLGDRKYDPQGNTDVSLGLCSSRLVFRHPKNGRKMEFQVCPKGDAFRGFSRIRE